MMGLSNKLRALATNLQRKQNRASFQRDVLPVVFCAITVAPISVLCFSFIDGVFLMISAFVSGAIVLSIESHHDISAFLYGFGRR